MGSRVLFVTDDFLKSGGFTPPMEWYGLRLQWYRINRTSWISYFRADAAADILESWARELLSRCAKQLIELQGTRERSALGLDLVGHLAEYAYSAACSPVTAFQADLCRRSAREEDTFTEFAKRDDLTHEIVTDNSGLVAQLAAFRKLLQFRAQWQTRLPGEPLGELGKFILERASSVCKMSDDNRRRNESLRAAAAVRLLWPMEVYPEAASEKLVRELTFVSDFYLGDDDGILLLAREPAFYAPGVILHRRLPIVSSFSFLEAARTSRVDDAGTGGVAAKAMAAV